MTLLYISVVAGMQQCKGTDSYLPLTDWGTPKGALGEIQTDCDVQLLVTDFAASLKASGVC